MVAVEEVLLCCWLSCLPQVWHTIWVESMVPARKISDSSDNGRVMEAVASWQFSEIYYLEIYCPNFVMPQCSYDNLRETRFSSKFCIWQNFYFLFFIAQTIIENWWEKSCGLLPKIQSEIYKTKSSIWNPQVHTWNRLPYPRWYIMVDWTAWGIQSNPYNYF